MKKLILVPAVLLLLACQDHNPVQPQLEVAAELALAQARGGPGKVVKMVPTKAKGTMWLVLRGDDSFCQELDGWVPGLTTFLESAGTATHMGRITTSLTNCYAEGRELLLYRQTLRAANGDEVWAEGRPDDSELPYQFIVNGDGSYEVLNIRVVGGTGRFQNAVGRWDCFGDNIRPLYFGGTVAFTCEGEISTVGSSK